MNCIGRDRRRPVRKRRWRWRRYHTRSAHR
jgi:hypothetical protein